MHWHDFTTYLGKLEGVSSRLTITAQLAELYQAATAAEAQQISYLLEGRLVPAYQGIEFQLSEKMVVRALARLQVGAGGGLFADAEPDPDALATAVKHLTAEYRRLGDLGLVTEMVTKTHRPPSHPTVNQVYDELLAIAQIQGTGSQEQKLQQLVELYRQLDAQGAKVVTRVVMGTLRLGFSTMTILDALSWAMTGGKADRAILETAYQKKADIGLLAATYLAGKTETARHQALEKYNVAVGVPVFPALCQRLNSAQEIIDKMGTVIAEPKYDGLRVQIHFRRQPGQQATTWFKTYTRSLEENTPMFPELNHLGEWLDCDECILDSEAVGVYPETGALRPFQETITRKRKHGVEQRAEDIPLRFFVFDVLSINGQSQLNEKLQTRKDRLKKLFKDNEVLTHAPYITTDDPKVLHAFHTEVLDEGLEGAVIKQQESIYQTGRKGWSWVKIKEAEGQRGKLNDTIDVVVMGYYQGRGKRTDFGLGAFLVGVLNKENQIVTVAKIGTGLSDEQFKELYQRAKPLVVNQPPSQYLVSANLVPDVWVAPEVVAEVAADELTNSPSHTAGLALRFPRLVHFRTDKKWQDITTVAELHTMQEHKKS